MFFSGLLSSGATQVTFVLHFICSHLNFTTFSPPLPRNSSTKQLYANPSSTEHPPDARRAASQGSYRSPVNRRQKAPLFPQTTAPRPAAAGRQSRSFTEATFFPPARPTPASQRCAGPVPPAPHLSGRLPRAGRLQRAPAPDRRLHGRAGPGPPRSAVPGTSGRFMEGARAAPDRPLRGRERGGRKHRPPQLGKGLLSSLNK